MASTITAGTTTGTALNFTGDTSGNLEFQTQAGANTITVPNATGTVVLANASGYILTPSNPAFTAQINGNSDATYNSGSNIPFNITGYNRGSNFNTSTYAFTTPVAGFYFFSASLYLTNSSGFNGNYQFGFVKNGAFITFGGPDAAGVVNGSPNANGGTLELSCTWAVNLSVGDTVAVQSRSASLRVYQGHCYFTGYLIG